MSGNETGGARIDRRVRRTVARLEHAMEELLGEKGLDALTVREIAARGDVNRATFYAHFADKEALFAHVLGRHVREALGGSLPAGAGATGAGIDLLTRGAAEILARLRAGCPGGGPGHVATVEREVRDEIRAVLAGPLRAADPRGAGWGASPELTAEVLGWAVFGAAREAAKEDDRAARMRVASAGARLAARLLPDQLRQGG